MQPVFMLIAVLLPLVGGLLIQIIKFKTNKARNAYTFILVLANTALVWALMLNMPKDAFTMFSFTKNITMSLKMDGMSCVFAGLSATLWPVATLYAFKYMTHEGHETSFFSFYTMSFGVTLGLAFAEDLFTFYFFYEFLTLITVPLVFHGRTGEAMRASRKYLYYSLGGAALAFIGMIFIITYGSADFVFGGSLGAVADGSFKNLLLVIYVLTVLGFGVKAAIFPLHGWLITAAVAPTPVTALLHAVAVVKAGVFAIMRVTYFNFGTELLKGTWAQYFVMAISLITILFGSSMAVHEKHIKRRFAYSTVSNLSYIVFAASLMSDAGLTAALSHMVTHGVMKICLFFAIGAITYQTGKTMVYEINGFGKKMPIIFASFTVASLSLIGIPLFSGFISKWNIATAAIDQGSTLAFIGAGVILISALLTAVYSLTVVVRGFFPQTISDGAESASDPAWQMTVPVAILAAACIVLGVYSTPLVGYISGFIAAM